MDLCVSVRSLLRVANAAEVQESRQRQWQHYWRQWEHYWEGQGATTSTSQTQTHSATRFLSLIGRSSVERTADEPVRIALHACLLSDDAYQKLLRKEQHASAEKPKSAGFGDRSPDMVRARAVAELLLSSRVYGYDATIGIVPTVERVNALAHSQQSDRTIQALSQFQADMDAIGGVVNTCTNDGDLPNVSKAAACRNISASESTTVDTLIELAKIAHAYLPASACPLPSVTSDSNTDAPLNILPTKPKTRLPDAVLCQTWQEALGGAIVRESVHPHGNTKAGTEHEVLQFAGAVRLKMYVIVG